jgi:hypothetical protein
MIQVTGDARVLPGAHKISDDAAHPDGGQRP